MIVPAELQAWFDLATDCAKITDHNG